mgnify:CR=1 FL=1
MLRDWQEMSGFDEPDFHGVISISKQMPDLRYGIRYLRFTKSARIDDITGF